MLRSRLVLMIVSHSGSEPENQKEKISPRNQVIIDSFPSQSRSAASMGMNPGTPANLISF